MDALSAITSPAARVLFASAIGALIARRGLRKGNLDASGAAA